MLAGRRVAATGRFFTRQFGGMGGGQGFQSNIDPEELFRTIFGDRGGQNPFGSFGFGGGQQAQEFDFGPKEYHVNLTFQQAASGVDKVRIKASRIETFDN